MINRNDIIVTGRFIKTAKLKEEWYMDIIDPEKTIKHISALKIKADILTIWQRLPESTPKYNYYMEWDSLAVLPIKSYKYWFEKQVDSKTRNLVRKAQKKGVDVKIVNFDDEFVKGLISIFNETPVRQGKPFWHYGLDASAVKNIFSRNLNREDVIGAYYNDDLIGFIMMANAEKFAMLTQILSKIEHRDKSPNNALIAKAVEICENKNIPYLVYAYWPKGSLADFKRNNGFKEIKLPRYYIPLTIKGIISLKLKIHHGIKGILPKSIIDRLFNLRNKWYSKKISFSNYERQ